MDAASVSAAKPPSGRKMKARAPPPPGKSTALSVYGEQKPGRDPGLSPQQTLINMKENLRNSMVDITVVLPSGLEKKSLVNGSHAMIDLLVELCLQNHLNPSHHALEIRSLETQQPLSFKPNTLVGTLDVHTVFLKEKIPEEKLKPDPPKVPEKSVRLVVNYLRTQKAVVRVSPEVPLQNILPVICAKCEVSPEHIILLRDNISGEELELSKSLNELGIKELYAWDNKRETFRKSSLGNDEIDKEKKKFLGFFKVNKRSNSKAESSGLLGVDNDEDSATTAMGGDMNGCLTTPNSPSVNSRSTTMGPSLSLSNISGMSVKSEMKKRRAPPPPSLPRAGAPVQDKALEKVSLGSQIDLQKKKRRAPAPPPPQPPPPSPLVPHRMEDREDNRKSTMGVGRQVPQKPPRGVVRGPPQLVLPPPPPYPPPDLDAVEPLGFPGEGAASKASDLRPKLNLPLGPSSSCLVDQGPLPLSEAEETVSVGSCFASEDTTEDSGVMSSPSDIISLDSQHDSTKSKDKWATDPEDSSDQDLIGTPELGPQRSHLWERNSSGHSQQRAEKAATVSNNDDGLFVTGQLPKSLTEFDEDLEEMEESYETDTSSLTNSLNGVPSHLTQDAIITNSDADAIPVTFIGEVLDDPVDLRQFSNRNNNAGSFDMGSITSKRTHLSSFQAEDSQSLGKKRGKVPESYAASQDTSKDMNPVDIGPKVTSTSVSKLHTNDLNAQEKGQVCGWAHSEKTQAAHRGNSQSMSENYCNAKNEVPALTSWAQRGQNPGGSYGLKYGLTTYKIIPPKSEMKCYDRGVSLSTGAIKIDDLGNLVNPHVNGSRTLSLSSAALEAEGQPVRKVREFWRSSSMEKPPSVPTECSVKWTTTALPGNPQNSESRHRAELSNPSPTLTSHQQQPLPQEDGRQLEEGSRQSPTAITGQAKGPATNTVEVPFIKPQRRTSSQYVASAIAKRMEPSKVHLNLMKKHHGAQRSYEDKASKPAGQHLAVEDKATSSLCSQTPTCEDSAEQPCSDVPSSNRQQAAAGSHLRAEISSPPTGRLSAQDCPAGLQKNSHEPPIKSSQKDSVSMGYSHGFNSKQSTRPQKTNSTCEPQGALPSTEAPRSHPTEKVLARALVNGSKWPPVNGSVPLSLRASAKNSCVVPDTEEKRTTLSTDAHEAEVAVTASIFGPKKKFKPVIQRPAPKDMSLHSALMEAIHSAGGRESLRKTSQHTSERGPKKPSYTETQNERSALLAAIRGHSGTSSLKKVSSFASEELQSLRDAELSAHGLEIPQQDGSCIPPPPSSPAPRMVSTVSMGILNNAVDARQALMDAIRSGSGAARLKKVTM
ncbi:protein cordon-bleu [Rhynchocyon petersi]